MDIYAQIICTLTSNFNFFRPHSGNKLSEEKPDKSHKTDARFCEALKNVVEDF